jgi:hypothetical protein
MFEGQQRQLLESLTDDQLRQLSDNLSPLGSLWLTAIPHNPFTTLSPREVAVGLSMRTLVAGAGRACQDCAEVNQLGHDDVCGQRRHHRAPRHEHVKHLLAYSLRQVKGTVVQVEPHLPGRQERTDLRISGPASFQQAATEYDLSIVSIFSQAAAARLAGNGLERLAAASAKVKEYLEDKGREKVRRYGGRTTAPFHPIILSLGGSMSPSTASIFAHWASAMTQEVYRQMELSISISLIRARARWFHL